jgi:hypothetical protein
MPNAADILWFKQNFQSDIQAAIASTGFTVDFMVALACQETGEVWPILRHKPLTRDRIVALCVGDTIDSTGGRGAFPTTKGELLAQPNGQAMFDIARQGLIDMATQTNSGPYLHAAQNPNKFCHGFGVFQYDIQFFKDDPQYFLQKKYEKFGETLGKALTELHDAAKKIHLDDKPSLTDMELCAVAICYNTGSFNPAKGLKQGHPEGGRFYGEEIFDFIKLSRTVTVPAGGTPAGGNASANTGDGGGAATGPFFQVATQSGSLRLRSQPAVSDPPAANVIGQLLNGQKVRAVTGNPVNNFMEIETSLNGATVRGFASADFLTPLPQA